MTHFAKIENDTVTQVIVAEQDFIDWQPGEWVQTSYNTRGGQHPEGRPLRKNYAGVGYSYDRQKDAFIPPQPFPSWTLNDETCLWEAPVPYPEDGEIWYWNEDLQNWITQ
jgi:hypothetical protein